MANRYLPALCRKCKKPLLSHQRSGDVCKNCPVRLAYSRLPESFDDQDDAPVGVRYGRPPKRFDAPAVALSITLNQLEAEEDRRPSGLSGWPLPNGWVLIR